MATNFDWQLPHTTESRLPFPVAADGAGSPHGRLLVAIARGTGIGRCALRPLRAGARGELVPQGDVTGAGEGSSSAPGSFPARAAYDWHLPNSSWHNAVFISCSPLSPVPSSCLNVYESAQITRTQTKPSPTRGAPETQAGHGFPHSACISGVSAETACDQIALRRSAVRIRSSPPYFSSFSRNMNDGSPSGPARFC